MAAKGLRKASFLLEKKVEKLGPFRSSDYKLYILILRTLEYSIIIILYLFIIYIIYYI